jgi:hypothetical protein
MERAVLLELGIVLNDIRVFIAFNMKQGTPVRGVAGVLSGGCRG